MILILTGSNEDNQNQTKGGISEPRLNHYQNDKKKELIPRRF